MDAVDSRIARITKCETEPYWWRNLADKARVSTEFNGNENWKICLSRLVNAKLANVRKYNGKYVATMTRRGKAFLKKGGIE